MKIIIAVILLTVGSTASATTNYIFYTKHDASVFKVSSVYSIDSVKDTLTFGDVTMSGIDWSAMRLDMTTDALPKQFTNIEQVSHSRVLPLTEEEKNDPASWGDKRFAAAIRAVVRLMNERLPEAQKVTDKDLIQAIGEEIEK